MPKDWCRQAAGKSNSSKENLMKINHILLTNDDGINATGLMTLCRALAEENPAMELSVIAPDRERSAVGHAITMHKPLRAEMVNLDEKLNLKGWAVNGTPSDCVKLGLEAILTQMPQLLISGINHGSNLGTDVLYSGTVSAAVEGSIAGIPSIAVSLTASGKTEDFLYAASLIKRALPFLEGYQARQTPLININVPVNTKAIKGIRVTSLGTRRYRNAFEKRVDPRGMHYYWMAGEVIEGDPENADSDTKAIREGYISVTPICFNLTDHESMPALKKIIERLG